MTEARNPSESQSMSSTDAGARDTFVIRIWTTDGADALRGHIQHVRTRKRAYFATPQRLLNFLQDHSETCRS
jgi:hypothetical protein